MLLSHGAVEVRGLSAQLVGKLACKVRFHPSVRRAVEGLRDDEDGRVSLAAKGALDSFARVEKVHAGLPADEKLIVVHGNYEELESYQSSLILYQGTVAFCDRFISRRSRTHDQMVQAARSGKQNIVEGCAASGTSKKTELKLVGVARASLQELLEDYRDFLRHRSLPIWAKDNASAKDVRDLAFRENRSYGTYKSYIEEKSPEIAANTLLCLNHQTNYLLDRQLESLEKAFVNEGGFSERLYRVRSKKRRNQG
jgi:four helix bundle suffix protein